MFEQRLAGCSVAGIARELTERSVPCPSDVDPERNRHRSGGMWTLRTVAVIPGKPAVHGQAGVESAAHRAHGSRGRLSVEPGGGVGDLESGRAPAAGERGGVRGRAVGAGGPSNQGRRRPPLPVGRVAGVSAVWSPDGLSLGAWAGWLSLPSRLHERLPAIIDAAEECLRA